MQLMRSQVVMIKRFMVEAEEQLPGDRQNSARVRGRIIDDDTIVARLSVLMDVIPCLSFLVVLAVATLASLPLMLVQRKKSVNPKISSNLLRLEKALDAQVSTAVLLPPPSSFLPPLYSHFPFLEASSSLCSHWRHTSCPSDPPAADQLGLPS